jgi:3-phytase
MAPGGWVRNQLCLASTDHYPATTEPSAPRRTPSSRFATSPGPPAVLSLTVLALTAALTLAGGVATTDNETPVLYDDDEGGNASGDDPAIWVHPDNSARSIVIVTAKEGGLRVYDLISREIQFIAAEPAPRADGVDGRYNNVDIAYGLKVGSETADVAVVSDRYNDQLRFFAIDAAGADAPTPLHEVTAPEQTFLFNPDRAAVDEERSAYGVAVWQPDEKSTQAVITQEGTTQIATARIVSTPAGIGYTDIRHMEMPGSFPLPNGEIWVPCEEPGVEPQLEGVAVDQRTGVLYATQEDVGLWRIPLPLGSGRPKLLDKVADSGPGRLQPRHGGVRAGRRERARVWWWQSGGRRRGRGHLLRSRSHRLHHRVQAG